MYSIPEYVLGNILGIIGINKHEIKIRNEVKKAINSLTFSISAIPLPSLTNL